MRELLAETRTTLNAGNQMAASVNGAIQSLDSFVRYVSPPKTNAAAGSGITNTNNPPFNILDYGTAAGQIGGMAKDVNALLTSVNQSVPQAAELGQQTKSNVKEVMKRAFWLGLLLILVLLVGLVLAGVAYKVTVSKLMHPERAPKSPQP